MKLKLPLFLALGALGLVACTPATTSSSGDPGTSSDPAVSSDPGTSSDRGTSSEPASSSDPIISSDPATSSEPVGPYWTAEDLATFTKVFGEHDIPYHDFTGEGHVYVVEEDVDGSNNPMVYIAVDSYPVADVAKVIETWTTGGVYADNTALYQSVPEGEYILDGHYDDYTHIQADMAVVDSDGYILTEGSGILFINLYCNGIPSASWPGAELNASIAKAFSVTDVTVPEPSAAAEAYLFYEYIQEDYFGSITYPCLDMFGLADVDAYGDQLVAAGWIEVEGAIENGRYLVDPSKKVGAYYIGTETNKQVSIQFLENSLILDWPAEELAQVLSMFLSATDVTLPAPSFEDEVTNYVFFAGYNQVSIYLYSGDFVSKYEADLVAAGYSIVTYFNGTHYYADPTKAITVMVTYNESDNSTSINLAAYDDIYFTSWPTEKVAAAVTKLGATGVTIPAPSAALSIDYIIEIDNISYYAYYELLLIAENEDGTVADVSAGYAATLVENGWVYDAPQGGYIDSTGAIIVTIQHSAGRGTYIDIAIAGKSSTSWPTDAVAATMSEYGFTGTMPAFENGSGYVLYADAENKILEVVATGVTAAEFEVYKLGLATAGWTNYVHEYNNIDIYVHDDSNMYITVSFDADSGRLTIQGRALSDYLLNTDDLTKLFDTLKAADAGFSAPEIPLGTGRVYGTVSQPMAPDYDMYWSTVTINDASVGTAYIAALEAESSGWTKLAEPSMPFYTATFTLVGTTWNWQIDITVDEENNYCTIEFTNTDAVGGETA